MPPAAIPFIIAGATAAGAGASIYSAKKQGSVANQQMQIAKDQFARTGPAYNTAYNYYNDLISGQPGTLARAVGPDINNVNSQFAQAQRNLLQNAQARSGGLGMATANLERGRASTIGQLIGTARQGAPAALSNLATGNVNQSLSALASAQQGQYQNALLTAQGMSGIGSFITRLLSNPAMFSGLFGGDSTPTSDRRTSVLSPTGPLPGGLMTGQDPTNPLIFH